MTLVEDLYETIKGAIEDYTTFKTKNIETNEDIDFEIYKAASSVVESIKQDLEELDDEIDGIIEDMNEPSDYWEDLKQDNIARTRDLIGGEHEHIRENSRSKEKII